MTNCHYCHKDLGSEHYRLAHAACWDEFHRRENAGKCVLCGDNDTAGNIACSACIANNYPPARNYPGGA